jgi:mannitol-1-phosphate 5-dehydrogenase
MPWQMGGAPFFGGFGAAASRQAIFMTCFLYDVGATPCCRPPLPGTGALGTLYAFLSLVCTHAAFRYNVGLPAAPTSDQKSEMESSPTLVQFGAGNIGRSFIGQIFARGGYEVVFVDIDQALVDALNAERAYRVVIKRNDAVDETLWVRGVRAIFALDRDAVVQAVADADLVATSVGNRALNAVLPVIADGLARRDTALDIVIAENLRNAADYFRDRLAELLPKDYPLDQRVGLVETSIGKMVPIMCAEDLETDPLWVFAEVYNNLIVDGTAFRTGVPQVDGIAPKTNMPAYVDRKLFIHNLGHAAAAYLGNRAQSERRCVWEVLDLPEVRCAAMAAMQQAAQALRAEYPAEFTAAELQEHIDDLLDRFANRALGDTVFRVGRDLCRKLGREDRLVGAMRLAARHNLEFDAIARAYVAALSFGATDEHGAPFPSDAEFFAEDAPQGLRHVLTQVSGLREDSPIDRRVASQITQLA